MHNQSVFNFFITNTVSNQYIHFFLILIEYLCFICPSSLNAAIKLNYINKSIEELQAITDKTQSIMLVQYIHLLTIIPMILVIISALLLLLYYIIDFIGYSKKPIFNIPHFLYVSLLDIILFRYASMLFLDSIINYSIKLALDTSNSVNSILSFLTLIYYFLFTLTTYNYIKQYSVQIYISNPLLVSKPQSYPYDSFSKEYELILLLLKVFISIEFAYYNNTNEMTYIITTLNICIMILSLVLLIKLYYTFYAINLNITLINMNILCNYLRKGIAVFNCSSMFLILITIYLDKNTIKGLIIGVVISLNMTIFAIYGENYLLNRYFITKEPLSYHILLYMMISDINENIYEFKKLQTSCVLLHKYDCRNEDCIICLQFSDDVHGNIRVFYKYYKKYIKTQKKIKERTQEEELTRLFYYKITKRSFKFFRYYYYLIHQYEKQDPDYTRMLTMIIEKWIVKDNNESVDLVENIMEIGKLEKQMRVLFEQLKLFVNEQIKVKRPEKVIELSTDIKQIMLKIKLYAMKNHKISNRTLPLDAHSKLINSAFGYIIMILRYSFETLINQPLSDLPPINIEAFEDQLHNHYSTDHVLICSIDLSQIYYKEYTLIKVTGPLSHKANYYKVLSDYFPKILKKEGNELLHRQLQQSNGDFTDQKPFHFPFITQGLLDYTKFSFSILETMKNNSLVLYGQYIKENIRCLLIDSKDPDSLEILAFCKEILHLFHIKKKWLGYLVEVNHKFYLQSLFKAVISNADMSFIECTFDYSHFLKKSKSIIQDLRMVDAFNNDKGNEISLQKAIDSLKKHAGKSIQIILEKKEAYGNKKKLYAVNFKGKCTVIAQHNQDKAQMEWDLNKNESMLWNLHSQTYSDSSVSAASILSTSLSKKNKTSEYDVLNLALKLKIDKESKVLKWYSISLLGLNVVLLLICIVFLFTQIDQTQTLSNLNDLFFRFKTIRICFVNFFMSLAGTVCIAEDPKKYPQCAKNGLLKYNKYFRETYGLDAKYDFAEYLKYELVHKAEYAQALLLDFKSITEQYSKSIDFQSVLTNPMKYYEFNQFGGLSINIHSIPFEEGIRQYINTMFIIVNYPTPFYLIPIYIISYINGTYYLDNIPTDALTVIKKELYKGLLNYINFYYSFKGGEESIIDTIYSLSKSNELLTTVFMIVIIALNLVLLFICQRNISIAYNLFKVLILNVIYKTEDKEFSKRINYKLDNLSSLVLLYDKNPNDIIKKLIVQQNNATTKSTKTKENATGSNASNNPYEDQENKEDEQIQVSFGSKFYHSLLGRLIIVLIVIFTLFFGIIVAFDIIISINFTRVFKIFDYILLQYTFENGAFIDVSFTVLTYIGNCSPADLASLMSKPNPEDGILNSLIRDSYDQYVRLSQYIELNSTDYPTLQNMLPNNCDTMFEKINDSYIVKIKAQIGIDFTEVSKKMCNDFQLLNVPNYAYIRVDLIQRTQHLVNSYTTNTYEKLYAFLNQYELYELYLISLLVYRPICSFFRGKVLLPSISNDFDFYVILVGVYLGVNILMELFVFVVVKFYITERLKIIQNNLYLLNNCVN